MIFFDLSPLPFVARMSIGRGAGGWTGSGEEVVGSNEEVGCSVKEKRFWTRYMAPWAEDLRAAKSSVSLVKNSSFVRCPIFREWGTV